MEKAREFQENIYFCFIDYAKAFDYVYHNLLWKILKEMGIPDHLTCLLRNLYTDQESTVRTWHGTTDCFQIGKGVGQGCMLSPCLFKLYAEWKWKWSRSVVSNSETPWAVAYHSSSVHGIFQAIVLEWIAISFSRGSSQPRDWTRVL